MKRMKGGEAHVVHLSPRAAAIVKEYAGLHRRYVFLSPKLNGEPLSNMALLMTLRRMKIADQTTVHGLCRSTFSTWANELGMAPRCRRSVSLPIRKESRPCSLQPGTVHRRAQGAVAGMERHPRWQHARE
jgi:integrase